MEHRHRRVLIAGAAAAVLSAAAGHSLYRQAVGGALLVCANGGDTAAVQAYGLTALFDQVSAHGGPRLPAAVVLAWAAVCLVAGVMRCEKLAPALLLACVAAPPHTGGFAPVRIGIAATMSVLSPNPVPLVHLLWVCYCPVELLPCAAMQLYEYNADAQRVAQADQPEPDEVSLLAPSPAPLTHIVTVTASKPLPARASAAPLP